MSNFWTISPHVVATLPIPGWECLFGKNDTSMRTITFWVWVLRCGDKVALIDTGLPIGKDLAALDKANQSIDDALVFTPYKSIAEILAEEGLTAADVNFVLISQLVTYSTGGLTQDAFPNAIIYCAWRGMEELLTECPGHPPRAFYFTHDSWISLHKFLLEERLVFARAQIEVAPGLYYEPTGGHHPGSAGVKIQTVKGIVGILETAFIQENIAQGRPIGIAEDVSTCRKAILNYRNGCALALAGHEPKAADLLREFLEN